MRDASGTGSHADDLCCCQCVRDAFLRTRISLEGVVEVCEQCGTEGHCVSLSALAEWIETIVEDHFQPGAGDSLSEIIQDIVGIDEDRAETLADWISSSACYASSGGETFFDSDGYVLAYRDLSKREAGWERFSKTVRSHSRYFNRSVEEWLDQIFCPLGDDRTIRGSEVFKTAGPGEQVSGFWRARQVRTVKDASEILGSPAKLLGPRAIGEGTAGRLNSEGISVFYGALDTETCVAEIRPPVGSIVIAGRFDLVRPIRLLDLDLLKDVQARCSHFDPEYHAKIDRALFLRAFGETIARPVLPGDETLGYLPTEIVADYLAQRQNPRVDGILYRSTQTDGEGRNVVLFEQACRVEPDMSGAALHGLAPISVTRRGAPVDTRPVTLKVDVASLEVSNIKATQYLRPKWSVEAWRMELEEQDHEGRWAQ